MDFFLTVINAVLYIILLYSYWIKNKYLNIGVFILSIWAFAATIGIYYETENIIGHIRPITLFPYIYLFVCTFFMFFPILQFRNQYLKTIIVNLKCVNIMSAFIIVVTIIPFCENLIYFVTHFSTSDSTEIISNFNKRYQDASLTYAYLSSLARKLNYISHSLQLVALVLLFYYFTLSDKKNKFIIIGLIIVYINPLIESINILARFMMVIYLFLGMFMFILFKPLYSQKTKILFYKIILIFGGIIIGAFIVLTLYRISNFSQKKYSGDFRFLPFISRYVSEGFGNFNGNMYHTDFFTHTDAVSRRFEIMFGIEEEDLTISESSRQFGFASNYFYTVVGDYYRGYGAVLTFLIFLIVPYFFYRGCRFKKNMRLSKILLLTMYAKWPLLGICYDMYLVDGWQLVSTSLAILIFYVVEKK